MSARIAFVGGGHMARCLVGGLLRQGMPAAAIRVAEPGAAQLMSGSARPPEELRRQVASPGGTTEAALSTLAQGRFVPLLVEAVSHAAQRGPAHAAEAARVGAGNRLHLESWRSDASRSPRPPRPSPVPIPGGTMGLQVAARRAGPARDAAACDGIPAAGPA
ncbi:pyrroline-5-carboxylate reductase family protein [Pseudoxanthomonas broegbernensis]|nr:pyrroline-5-carboxylate reductase dimerization domain-containing protein [Pseudoxanthomonas broegbernensis]MBB6063517.1 hypothetical protein [Pseudoxanthomonas broegbernensis]